jgi:hypothetical protein
MSDKFKVPEKRRGQVERFKQVLKEEPKATLAEDIEALKAARAANEQEEFTAIFASASAVPQIPAKAIHDYRWVAKRTREIRDVEGITKTKDILDILHRESKPTIPKRTIQWIWLHWSTHFDK